MLYTKACPRCSGDIKLDRDNFGVYAKCLQCGFNRDFHTRREDALPGIGIAEAGATIGPEIIAPDILGEDEHREAA